MMLQKFVALVVVLVCPFAVNAQDLQNASFEQPNMGTGYSAYAYNPTGAGWTFAGLSGIQANGSAWSGDWFMNPATIADATDGIQTAFLQSIPSYYSGGTSIFQTVENASLADFSFSFDLAQRTNYGNGGPQTLSVMLDGDVLGSYTATSTFQSYALTVNNVDAGSHTLMFIATNLNNAVDTAALIDNVRMDVIPIAAIPEPEIYAMMGVGLGLLGWVGRRKKLQAA